MKRLLLLLSCTLCCTLFLQGQSVAPAARSSLRILYFNDAHELNPVQTSGGLLGGVSRMKALIDSIRRDAPEVIVIFGGDLAGGTLGGKLFRGSVMIASLNAMRMNYANFGQHEFDYGVENAEQLVAQSDFTWLTSNVVRTNGDTISGAQPFVVHLAAGKTVGIIGLTDKINTSKPTSGVQQIPIIEAAQSTIRRMGKVDYLVAVTQMAQATNEELLVACPDIDLVLTEETSQYKTEVQFYGLTPMIAGCGNMGQLADVSVQWPSRNVQIAVHTVHNERPEDPVLSQYAREQTESATSRLSEHLSVASTAFAKQASSQSSYATGCVVADAYRAHYSTDIAIINGGGIRALLPAGNIMVKEAFAVLPFENVVVPVRIDGRKVKEIVCLAAERMLPQVSGLTYEVKLGAKTEVGAIYVNGYPLDENKAYTVALPDYILLGSGNFIAIPRNQWLLDIDSCAIDADILIAYLRAHPQLEAPDCKRIKAARQ